MRHLLIFVIKIYQKIPGPWHDYCIHQPTCSNYTIGALEEFGCVKGIYLGIKRILKCNPLGKGGYDPVPTKVGGKDEKN